jgi:RNA polymerase sigma-70 factor (ECF subfamily)
MEVLDAEKDLGSYAGAEVPDIVPSALDSVEQLATVYRDYPGLRALIMRRVRDPHLAADILQDAAVTTLEKLKSGEIAQPGAIGGYLYRVALNHLRNHRRKDRAAVSSSEDLESLPDAERVSEVARIEHSQWADAARKLLDEMPTTRDREVLMRFYLNDESREDICVALQLSDAHFNRVIFRARNRFRALLESRGYAKLDLLSLGAFGLGTGTLCAMFSSCVSMVA